MLRLGEHEIWAATAAGIAPRPRITPLVFADEHRVFGKENRSSRYRTSDTPWARRIFWALSDDSPYQMVVCPKGTQLGFTEIGLIWIGQGIVEGRSALVIFPTEATAKKVVKTKFRPMLLSTTILKGVFVGRSADSTLHFSAPTVDVMFAGSNSSSNFATVTVFRAFGDEIDRWDPDLAKEGDPLGLLVNRIADAGFLGKLFLPCSPTVEGVSLVWREYLQTNMEVFEAPCPDCGIPQAWHWENMTWDEGQPATAALKCVSCGEKNPEHRWKAIWGQGEWRSTNASPVRSDSIGFHVNSLYGRLGGRSWAQLVQRYIADQASGQPSRLQTFWNTILGLPWKISEDAIPVEELRARLELEHERGVIPARGLSLFTGIDYQANRLEAFIWAFGPRYERWLVEKVVIPRLDAEGKLRPGRAIADDLRAEVLDKDWPHALGGSLRVELSVHDASDKPSDVFDVLDHLPTARNVATKGDEGWGKVARFEPARVVDVTRDGKVVKRGRKLAKHHSAEAKRDWFSDLRRPQEAEGVSERFVHLPAWIDEEEGLLEQFVAEEIRKSSRGKPMWHKLGRNEALDCAIMAMGAHWHARAHRWSAQEWARREKAVSAIQKSRSIPEDGSGTPQPQQGRRSRRGGRF